MIRHIDLATAYLKRWVHLSDLSVESFAILQQVRKEVRHE